MKKIALLTGGPGYERNIALQSCSFFQKFLQVPYEKYILPEQLDKFLQDSNDYDVVVPIFHGEYGEDGKIFALLDMLEKKYPFSSHDVHALCLNKFFSNSLVSKELNIKVGKQCIISKYDQKKFSSEEIYNKLISKINLIGFPCILKPTHGGSSLYTYKIQNKEDFIRYGEESFGKIDDTFLLQEFIVGEEYSVPIIKGTALEHIMKVEKKDDEIFDYEAKYEDNVETFPEIETELKNRLKSDSVKIYKAFGCKTLARMDFIVRDGIPYFIEINTIPGMSEVSILPKAWKLTGKTFEEFVQFVIDEAK